MSRSCITAQKGRFTSTSGPRCIARGLFSQVLFSVASSRRCVRASDKHTVTARQQKYQRSAADGQTPHQGQPHWLMASAPCWSGYDQSVSERNPSKGRNTTISHPIIANSTLVTSPYLPAIPVCRYSSTETASTIATDIPPIDNLFPETAL